MKKALEDATKQINENPKYKAIFIIGFGLSAVFFIAMISFMIYMVSIL